MTTSAMIVGPLIGGLLVDLVSWRLAFLINVVPDRRDPRAAGTRRLPRHAASGRIDRLDRRSAVHTRPRRHGLRPHRAAQPRLGLPRHLADARARRRHVRRVHPASAHACATRSCRSTSSASATSGRATWRPRSSTAPSRSTGFVVVVYLQEGAGLPATLAGLASLPMTILMILLSSRIGALSRQVGPALLHDGRPDHHGHRRAAAAHDDHRVLVLVAGAAEHDRDGRSASRSPSPR